MTTGATDGRQVSLGALLIDLAEQEAAARIGEIVLPVTRLIPAMKAHEPSFDVEAVATLSRRRALATGSTSRD